ncbi:MAG TPA: bifunctional [glutamate--ammonia ligase]-adenylyl-L-tyrosine phosphorylase/[glutamate--ammonia-ligase] adenylyltransferase [Gemmataceae bacterium]|nr:bifunctional [glutamate--ammonia ligase]-adenylyl-L-tyrosine phosphorylase/[glutamate--ammonia-ligase] adenylyltransferase [Gemmataceae bacterium]
MSPDVQPLPAAWPVRDPDRGRRNLTALAEHLGPKGFLDLMTPLARWLPRSPDPDLALNNLERFLSQPGGRGQLPTLLEGRGRTLDTFLRLLGTSQFFADVLAAEPEVIELLRGPGRRTPDAAELRSHLRAAVDAAGDEAGILRAFRRFRRRQILRIGVNDIVRDRPLEEVTRDISRAAEAAVQVAVEQALKAVTARFGEPLDANGQPIRLAVIGFGKLGGEELNYSSDIDLMFVHDADGDTQGRRPIAAPEFFGRVVSEVVRLLSAHTPDGQAYRVDLRLRPEGSRGPLSRTLASTLSYYDAMGRTWERQALIKARPVGGDPTLGREFLQAIEPFIYRKYFSFSEINEVKALKRTIERKARDAGADDRDVKTGRGGIRDIEFAVQFLQLLNGGDLPAVRERNTLLAVHALAVAGCLTGQEAQILDDTYRFLRKTEHRLQLLFDLQTHRLPTDADELRRLSLRMGYAARRQKTDDGGQNDRSDSVVRPPASAVTSPQAKRPQLDEVPAGSTLSARPLLIDPLDAFLHDLHAKTELNRVILDHLLHQTFQGGDAELAAPEADLVLDPHPDAAAVTAVLSRYGFRNLRGAYQNLSQLAQESVPFLSARRCRHFLASIAPRLLREIARTPDPDQALTNLEKVTASLGAKAVLWELFSFSPPSLRLCVDLCAGSQFLTDILVNNPGMIDELLDSLVLNRPRTVDELRTELAALCANAADPRPILHSFQDKELLRIGVADLLGKTPEHATAAGLSDLAETILGQIARLELPSVVAKYGPPRLADGRPCRWVILALGKLGGRELSYHSDLDLVLVYEGDAPTGSKTDNLQFFSELARQVIRTAGGHGPMGRLYAVDMRLRPTGGSGSLAAPLAEFERYYAGGGSQVWERQALTKARTVVGEPAFRTIIESVARRAAFDQPCPPGLADEVRAMRTRIEVGHHRDLKRGPGGIVDVEFVVQLMQLHHAAGRPDLQLPNTRDALSALHDAGLLTDDDHAALRAGHDFLRLAENRLRGVTNRASDELPDDPAGLAKLARRLGYDLAERFLSDLGDHTKKVRAAFERVCARERG